MNRLATLFIFYSILKSVVILSILLALSDLFENSTIFCSNSHHICSKWYHLSLSRLFGMGKVYIYKNYEPNYTDPSSSDFCHKTLYLFAFCVTNSCYILFGVVLVIGCVTGIAISKEMPCREEKS